MPFKSRHEAHGKGNYSFFKVVGKMINHNTQKPHSTQCSGVRLACAWEQADSTDKIVRFLAKQACVAFGNSYCRSP